MRLIFYKSIQVVLLTFVALGFFGCNGGSFSMLDYYFPLHEIKTNKIYMYEVDVDNLDGSSIDTSYLNIGRIVDGKYYFLTVGSDLIAKDSAIIMVKDGQILLYQLFIFHEGRYIKGLEENQTIYPKKVRLYEAYTTNHSFTGLNISNLRSNMQSSFETQVVEKSDSMVVVNMITRTNLQSTESNASNAFRESAVIKNQKGVGLVSWTNRGKDFYTDRKLVRMIDVNEWKKMLDSRIVPPTTKSPTDSTDSVNSHEGHNHP